LFAMGCNLIILACNTASAKALRFIQQNYLPVVEPKKRVLGVIRPTSEKVGQYSVTKHIGILGTTGTIASLSYPIEIEHFFPDVKVYQQECPMLVPLVENNEYNSPGSDYFIKKYIDALFLQSDKIDTLILGCTHYPLLLAKIKQYLPNHITLLSQSEIVAQSLKDYLHRHPELERYCQKHSDRQFYTSDDPASFNRMAGIFYGEEVVSHHIEI